MCQATVYLQVEGQKEEVMREVISLVAVEGGVLLATFFEEPRAVAGRVQQIDFLKHTVTLVPLGGKGA